MTPFFAPVSCATDDFTIRAYAPGDGPALSEATSTSYEHLRPWMSWATAEDPADEAEARVRRFAGTALVGTDFTLGVWSPRGDRLLGGTGFHLRGHPVSDQVAEIGMWIRASEAGQGLGTAVLRTMLDWGFDAWPWERLAWHCDSRNTASRRTAERAGMRLEGTLRGDKPEVGEGRRDTLVFGLVRSDPRGEPAP